MDYVGFDGIQSNYLSHMSTTINHSNKSNKGDNPRYTCMSSMDDYGLSY